LGISKQRLHKWRKAETVGRLREVSGKAIRDEQLEIARLKAELAETRMERDILEKSRRLFWPRREVDEVRSHRSGEEGVPRASTLQGSRRQPERVFRLKRPPRQPPTT
jgi:transposase-like protein